MDPIDPIYICDILKSFDPKLSPDLDGISTDLLKFLNTVISVPLAHIFNIILTTGIFPNKLKSSRVVLIFKSGDPRLCDNYWPISLISTISEIYEKIIATKLTNHSDLNKLLYSYQFGFQRGLSTEHNLIQLTNFISSALNENKYCIGICLDLKKAFDVVDHQILLTKLENLGIQNNIFNWFKSYFLSRTQYVETNGKLSGPKNLIMSVFQGSTV